MYPNNKNLIILFTKYPEPGKCKTRLIPFLGPEGACNLQKWMLTSIISTIESFCEQERCSFEIHYNGNSKQNAKKLMENLFGNKTPLCPQGHGNLGEKMKKSLTSSQSHHTSIVLVGSDCPDISPAILQESFHLLNEHQVVLGPTYDGGYYLIGIQASLSQEELAFLFHDIPWSSDKVLKTSMERLRKKKISFSLVTKLHDIDTPDDLRYLNNYPDSQ